MAKRQMQVKSGAQSLIRGGEISNADRRLEKMVRNAEYRAWNPVYHWRRYWDDMDDSGRSAGQIFAAELAAFNGRLPFFTRVFQGVTGGDPLGTNLITEGQMPYAQDADGLSVHVRGNTTINKSELLGNGIPYSLLELLAEHCAVEFRIRKTRTLIDVLPLVSMSPGMGVQGAWASTINDMAVSQEQIGSVQPRAYHRFGGPDPREVEYLQEKDPVEGTLIFGERAMDCIQAAFPEPEETPQDVSCPGIVIGMMIQGWTYKALA